MSESEKGSHRGCVATAEPVPQRMADAVVATLQAPEGKPRRRGTKGNLRSLDSLNL